MSTTGADERGRGGTGDVSGDERYGRQLTSREREMLALVADGLTNRQIADRLFVEPTTIKATLTIAYAKIGTSGNRVLAARWWWERGNVT